MTENLGPYNQCSGACGAGLIWLPCSCFNLALVTIAVMLDSPGPPGLQQHLDLEDAIK